MQFPEFGLKGHQGGKDDPQIEEIQILDQQNMQPIHKEFDREIISRGPGSGVKSNVTQLASHNLNNQLKSYHIRS